VKPLLRPRQGAEKIGVGLSSLPRLRRDEALPAVILGTGPKGRQIVRYDPDALDAWLESRRERQVMGTLTGARFTRKAEP